jgi:protein-tyrosine-phosphatase
LNAAGVGTAVGPGVDFILDGGHVSGGRSSTVVQCDDVQFSVLRRGAVPTAVVIKAATELILLACTGNLCRSPLAEACLRREVAAILECDAHEVVRRGFRFGSFGTTALEGEPATEQAQTVATERGLDLSGHRSRPFRIGRVRHAAKVYCMTHGHQEFLRPYFQNRADDLDLLCPRGREIDDPYGRALKVYRRAAERIEEACARRAEELVAGVRGDSGE